jgi:hypothetical protein
VNILNYLLIWSGWGLNSGLHTCKAGTHKVGSLPLEPHLQSKLTDFKSTKTPYSSRMKQVRGKRRQNIDLLW